MFKEFKQFLFRGNLLDLATAVVIGVAFTAVVNALVSGIITPLIAAVAGRPTMRGLTVGVGDGVISYGLFIDALIQFVIVAAVMFLILKAASKAQRLRASTDVPADETPPPSDEALLLAEIRDLLRARATG
jgi:large conductance mechanosensitive channel